MVRNKSENDCFLLRSPVNITEANKQAKIYPWPCASYAHRLCMNCTFAMLMLVLKLYEHITTFCYAAQQRRPNWAIDRFSLGGLLPHFKPYQGSYSFELFKFHDFLHDLFKFSRLWVQLSVFKNSKTFPCFRVYFDLKQFNRHKLWCPPKCVPFTLFNHSFLSVHCPCLVICSN